MVCEKKIYNVSFLFLSLEKDVNGIFRKFTLMEKQATMELIHCYYFEGMFYAILNEACFKRKVSK